MCVYLLRERERAASITECQQQQPTAVLFANQRSLSKSRTHSMMCVCVCVVLDISLNVHTHKYEEVSPLFERVVYSQHLNKKKLFLFFSFLSSFSCSNWTGRHENVLGHYRLCWVMSPDDTELIGYEYLGVVFPFFCFFTATLSYMIYRFQLVYKKERKKVFFFSLSSGIFHGPMRPWWAKKRDIDGGICLCVGPGSAMHRPAIARPGQTFWTGGTFFFLFSSCCCCVICDRYSSLSTGLQSPFSFSCVLNGRKRSNHPRRLCAHRQWRSLYSNYQI